VDVPAYVAWQLDLKALRQQVLVVALADAQATQRPQATEVEIGKRTAVTKITIREDFG
jgi:hypothetical protein